MTSQVTGAGEELNRKKLFMKMKFHVESFSSLLNKKKKREERINFLLDPLAVGLMTLQYSPKCAEYDEFQINIALCVVRHFLFLIQVCFVFLLHKKDC